MPAMSASAAPQQHVPPSLPPFTAASFPPRPDRQCDIVMKGGITSGVIYPWAVCELAGTYRLHSVGGASAGAIAAAAAVSAELGRQRSTTARTSPSAELPPGFAGLARFPELLSQRRPDGRSLLFGLFRPQPQTRRLFELVTASLDDIARLPRPVRPLPAILTALRTVGRSARRAPRRALLGLLPGLLVVALSIVGLVHASDGLATAVAVVSLVLGLALGLAGVTTGVIVAILADVLRLPRAGFGITSGRGLDDTELALTPWLHARLQELAGAPGGVLTFGELRAQDLDLQVMTTNLSRKQPLSMPWNHRDYFFDPADFEPLFGPQIVQHLVDHPPPAPEDEAERHVYEAVLARAGRLRPFPAPDDLPIIVATRMSLSFPILISAVPLFAVDWTRPRNLAFRTAVGQWWRDHPEGSAVPDETPGPTVGPDLAPPVFDVNWFSDGGLTSNLPVQFFDSPLPSRPTFAIDLDSFTVDRRRSPSEEDNSELPTSNAEGLYQRTGRWESKKSLGQLLAFLVSLVETARNWVDESALVMPGYRDRVVTVFQDGDEGGLNLSMPPEVVERLGVRGRLAARKLTQRFAVDEQGWRNHRWVRFRAASSALSDWFTTFGDGYRRSVDPTIPELFEDQPSYVIAAEDLPAVKQCTDGLLAEIADWDANAAAITRNRPQEPPALRLTSPIGAADPVPAHPGLAETLPG